jgi:MinD superfamily P-loop ATPase
MKQLVILSGKGGTGKTTVTAAFAHLSSLSEDTRAVLVDADVDASNLELLLCPTKLASHEFVGWQTAMIDKNLCTGCGICVEVCRFDAVRMDNGIAQIDQRACEGCAACETQCPEKAIQIVPQVTGDWFVSESRYGTLFHAQLTPARENSGKLVTLLRQQARQEAKEQGYPLVLVDGPPGTGCPSIAAMTGTDLVLAVTEPTTAGIHDLKRLLSLTNHFGIRTLVTINKSDLYPDGTAQILDYCRREGLEVLGSLPFDLTVPEAMVQGQTITAYQPDGATSTSLEEIWRRIVHIIQPTP